MNVKWTLRTLCGLPPRKSILLESDHGLGKSATVRQAAAILSQRLKKPFYLTDFRLAQCEVGDLIGMPKSLADAQVKRQVFIDGVPEIQTVAIKDVTVHDLAEWFPTDPDSCGFLFLDELFRASKDLQNAVMELALDYRYHFRELPIGWRVVSASNDNMDVYNGFSPDPALYDRFLKIKFKPTHPEWMEYAASIAVHQAVLRFIAKFPRELGLERTGKIEAGKIVESPRAWINLSDCIKYMTDQGDEVLKDHEYLHYLARGYIGDTTGTAWIEWVKKDFRVYSAEDILNKWSPEMEKDFEAMLVNELSFYETELISFIKGMGKPLSKKQSENLGKWYTKIPKECASGFWGRFSADCRDVATKWYKETAGIADYTIGFLSRRRSVGEAEEK